MSARWGSTDARAIGETRVPGDPPSAPETRPVLLGRQRRTYARVNSAVILGVSSMALVQVIGWVAVAAGAVSASQSLARLSDAARLGWLRRAVDALSLTAKVSRRKARQTLYSSLATIAVGLVAVRTGGDQGAAWLAVVIVAVVAVTVALRAA